MTELPHCEHCDQPSIPIVYGLPEGEVLEWVEKGWVAFGGDAVTTDFGFRCPNCEHEFGRCMPDKDLEVWIGLKRANELFSHGKKIEAIQMLRADKNLSIKDCLDMLKRLFGDQE